MAKVIWKQASKDDPIYTGRFIISSPNKRHPVKFDRGSKKGVVAENHDKG